MKTIREMDKERLDRLHNPMVLRPDAKPLHDEWCKWMKSIKKLKILKRWKEKGFIK